MRLGDVANYIGGVTFAPDDKVSPDADGAVVCMRTKNIQADLDQTDLLAIPPTLIKRDEQYLRAGDILVSSANSWNLVAKCCYVPEITYKATAGGFIAVLRARGDVTDSRYLYHWLSWDRTQTEARACARQTTNIANLSRERFLDLELPLPPLEEQRRIAAILDKADAIRRKRQEAIALTEQLLRSTFLEMFGDPITNPKGWPEKSLRDLADIGSGVMKGRDYTGITTVERPYMRVANVQDGYLALDSIKTIELPEVDADKYTLRLGDVLLTEGGDPDKLGRGAVWMGEIDGCVHQNHIFRVRPLGVELDSEYLCALLGSARGKRYFLRSAKQTTGIASINRSQLSEFPVLVPPHSVQQEYRRFVEMHKRLSARLSAVASEQEHLFHSLTHRAFTGQL